MPDVSTTVVIPDQVKKALDSMAAKAGVPAPRLLSLLLEAFVEGEGKVYTGSWPEGPGIRLLPDWPRFTSKTFHIKREEMK
ncbi:MAG: hypothetical protein Q8O76_01605 [Chloroflexota bacterium]|nr:hypothetical protein [Chloroflexota bacterium]